MPINQSHGTVNKMWCVQQIKEFGPNLNKFNKITEPGRKSQQNVSRIQGNKLGKDILFW